jgi:hypothetical protein
MSVGYLQPLKPTSINHRHMLPANAQKFGQCLGAQDLQARSPPTDALYISSSKSDSLVNHTMFAHNGSQIFLNINA